MWVILDLIHKKTSWPLPLIELLKEAISVRDLPTAVGRVTHLRWALLRRGNQARPLHNESPSQPWTGRVRTLFLQILLPSSQNPILSFFSLFHQGLADTERLNHAHIVLLPKKEAPTTLDAFRPISLQNCPIKVVAKVITSRLKPLIPLLVHGNHTGFISGRNITNNFLFAAVLISSCHTRKNQRLSLS